MPEWTPTDTDMRDIYALGNPFRDPAALAAEFDRWLADHDAEVCAPLEAERDDYRDNPRDEHHTMAEVYDYRMLYNAHAAAGWWALGIPVVKSWHHSDGEPCFGGGWFIVTATLPTGQVSNHYRAEFWDLFAVPGVDLPPEYDGHTPQVAADRLRAALADPTPEATA